LLQSSQKYRLEIRDRGFKIRDPEKTHPGSRGQKSTSSATLLNGKSRLTLGFCLGRFELLVLDAGPGGRVPGLPAEAGAAPAPPHPAGQRTTGARRPSRPHHLRIRVQKKEGSLKNWLQGGGCSPINPLVLFMLISFQMDPKLSDY
jgi:hypothetical protein